MPPRVPSHWIDSAVDELYTGSCVHRGIKSKEQKVKFTEIMGSARVACLFFWVGNGCSFGKEVETKKRGKEGGSGGGSGLVRGTRGKRLNVGGIYCRDCILIYLLLFYIYVTPVT